MPSFFSKVFKGKDGAGTSSKSKKNAFENDSSAIAPQKPRWKDAWLRKELDPEEVHELLRGCTQEMKSRALDTPFLLLPFRPTSDSSAAKTFVRNFFNATIDNSGQFSGEHLKQELRLTEPMVLCSVMKWCWSRIPGGVVSWEAYELFRVGEHDSNQARDAFATFIPISVESDARSNIIFDFFDLLTAVAAHGKANGLGGGKLSRLAGWWAFEHSDSGDGFDGGYKSWASAADATSHLFFAYLRSLSPDSVKGISGISTLPLSLQALLQSTDYPPAASTVMHSETTKVVMIVDSVSPTPFSLLRRAKHFEYRDDDEVLQHFAEHEDPVQALTQECHRVLSCISSTNQSVVSASKTSPTHQNTSWSRFEDLGFSGLTNEDRGNATSGREQRSPEGLRSTPHSRAHDHGRPTTPSWADFLSSGFVDEPSDTKPAPLLLPPDKILPPIETSRDQNAQLERQAAAKEANLEPGELASITRLGLDDSFWWVWITSLAGEETLERKAVFGRCALIETSIAGGRWLIIEEKVKGTVPTPDENAYVVEKKSRFSLTKRMRGKSYGKKNTVPPRQEPYSRSVQSSPLSKTSIGPDQHARIQAAAAALQKKQAQQDLENTGLRRARTDDARSNKTNSVFTLQPVIMNEATSAMQWANKFDKDARRAAYLGDNFAGRGDSYDTLPTNGMLSNGAKPNGIVSSPPRNLPEQERDLPALPRNDSGYAPPKEVERAITPPPLPATPVVEKEPANEYAAEAAEVPLPATTPMERQPLSPVKQAPTHPAFRANRVPTDPTLAASAAKSAWLAANAAPQPTQVMQSPPTNKLQKRGGGGGLTKLWGKKDAQPQYLPAAPQETTSRPSLQVPQQSSLSRRLSKMRKKSSPAIQQTANKPLGDDNDHVQPSTMPAPTTSSPAADADDVEHPYYTPKANLSRAEIDEQPPQLSHPHDTINEQPHQPSSFSANFQEPQRQPSFSANVQEPQRQPSFSANVQEPQHQPSFSANVQELQRQPSFSANVQEPQHQPSFSANVQELQRQPSFSANVQEPQHQPSFSANVQELQRQPSFSANVQEPQHQPSFSANVQEPQRQPSFSRVDTREQGEADRAFQSFDQGPLGDVPAFVPDDSPERAASSAFFTPAPEPKTRQSPTEKTFQTRAAAMLFSPAPSQENGGPNRVSEISTDEEPVKSVDLTREVSPVDRWAQIRKNAAERAAARENEDQSRPSQIIRTDEDETSGEETIESRVARIKARVAELTGNMEGQITVRR
ncbi:MAG: hypothetical protein M1812_003130 [Candelaria pacifica]|nr:MAG: hypothetical protein M1812_003130 [Candelaria pacifica]